MRQSLRLRQHRERLRIVIADQLAAFQPVGHGLPDRRELVATMM